jgi:predicted MFS family arabinose efflux permease
MVVAFQVAISIGAVFGGYIVDYYGATAPLTLTALLAATTIALGLMQRDS